MCWKVYGPDLNGRFGGLQGTGGLEAVILDADGTTTGVINDQFGNGVASVSGGSVTWYATRVGAYGPLPGIQAQTLTDVTQVAASTAWRSRRIDPTGFYWLGARYYEPTSGRFLSADPMGQSASPSLYDFAGGDPVNSFDPDGRCKNSTNNTDYTGIGGFFRALQNVEETASQRLVDNIENSLVGAARYGIDLFDAAGSLLSTGNVVDPNWNPISPLTTDSRPTVLGFLDQQTLLATGNTATFGLVSGAYDLATGNYQGAQDSFAMGLTMLAGVDESPGVGVSTETSTPQYIRSVGNDFPNQGGEFIDQGFNSTAAGTTSARTTILGENMAQRTMPFAEATNAETLGFGATREEWAAMSPAERWKLNDGMLRTRMDAGDEFRYIGQDPLRNPALRAQFDLTGSELLRLNGRNVPYEIVSPTEVQTVLGHP